MSGVALQIGLAFTEGLALAFSPCILPVLPLILAGGAAGGKSRPLGIVTGFVIFFTLFALLSRHLLSLFGIAQDTLQTISFSLLILFGLVMVVPALERGFAKLTQGIASRAQNLGSTGAASGEGFSGGVILGGLIGLVWTPCAGPIMAAALLQVIQSTTSFDAIAVIFAFSVGAAVPMLAIAFSSQAIIARVRTLNHHTAMVRRAMGVLLIVVALLGLSGVNLGVAAVSGNVPVTSASFADDGRLRNPLPAPVPAPDFTGIAQWLNGPALTMADLKGKVVLVDFWTYSCINCIRTFPYLKDWYAKYKDDGFVIVGVHTPEFAFEGNPDNVVAALKKYGLTYPVAMDNNFATWNAYRNQYWPAHYLIDRDGKIVYTHFGEGHYDVTEQNIRTLLSITTKTAVPMVKKASSADQTHETYLGTARANNESTITPLPLHHWMLSGEWKKNSQYIEATRPGALLTLHFRSKKVFLVLASATGQPVRAAISVSVPGSLGADARGGEIVIKSPRLYELANLPQAGEAELILKALDAGVQAYAFTFETSP